MIHKFKLLKSIMLLHFIFQITLLWGSNIGTLPNIITKKQINKRTHSFGATQNHYTGDVIHFLLKYNAILDSNQVLNYDILIRCPILVSKVLQKWYE